MLLVARPYKLSHLDVLVFDGSLRVSQSLLQLQNCDVLLGDDFVLLLDDALEFLDQLTMAPCLATLRET